MTTAIYQVVGWDDHFENNKSRERDQCSFVCVPNKQDGLGLTYILSQPDGAGIYGIWNLILGACSRQCRQQTERGPRRLGYLTENGLPTGRPWSAHDLALRWRRKVEEVQRALDFLCSAEVGWLRVVMRGDHNQHASNALPASAHPVPAECPRSALEGKGREGKRNEGEGPPSEVPPPSSTTEASAAKSPRIEDQSPIVLTYPCSGDPKEWHLRKAMVDEFSKLYPDTDVLAQCRAALGWVRHNKRKTAKGMGRFLNAWLAREQDRPRTTSVPPPRSLTRGMAPSPLTKAIIHE